MIEGLTKKREGGDTSGSFKQYTGLAPVKILKANPTTEEFKALSGREQTMKYDPIDLGGKIFKPFRLVISQPDNGVNLMDFLISAEQDVASTGSIKYMSVKGNFSYAKTEEQITSNSRMEWFGEIIRPAFKGEEEIITLFRRMFVANDKENTFVNDIINNFGYDYMKMYNGDVTAINKLIDYGNENDLEVIVPYGIKETVSQDGKDKNYLVVITRDSPFYNMNSMNYAITNFAELVSKKAAEGYDMKYFKSVDFVQFGGASAAPTPATKPEDKVFDDLPF